jgi:hypothetical protein
MDISQSPNTHNFTGTHSAPNWDYTQQAIKFNGSDDLMMTADHPDINTSVTEQRTFAIRFKTGPEVSSRQVIYEEGGMLRGLNVYIFDSKVYCGFWNRVDDADRVQEFTSVSTAIDPNTKANIFVVIDYSNFTGRDGADGDFYCFNGLTKLGEKKITSRLHPHSGNIGLGSMNDGSYFESGYSWGEGFHFKGNIYELLMYNTAHSDSELQRLHQNLSSKW